MYNLEDHLENMLDIFLSDLAKDYEEGKIDFKIYDPETEFNKMVQERISNFIGIIDWEATQKELVSGSGIEDLSQIERSIALERVRIKWRDEDNEDSIRYIKRLEDRINQIQGH